MRDLFRRWFGSRAHDAESNESPKIRVRYRYYRRRIDLPGDSPVWLCGSRDALRKLFPFLADFENMEDRWIKQADVTVMTDQVADEVHEFRNARQRSVRVTHIFMRSGNIIGMQLK